MTSLLFLFLATLASKAVGEVNVTLTAEAEIRSQGNCVRLLTCITGPIIGNLFWYATFSNGSDVRFARNDGGNGVANPPYIDFTLANVTDYFTRVTRSIIGDDEFTEFNSTLNFNVRPLLQKSITSILCGSVTRNSSQIALVLQLHGNYTLTESENSMINSLVCTGTDIPLNVSVGSCSLDVTSSILQWIINGTIVVSYDYVMGSLKNDSGNSNMYKVSTDIGLQNDKLSIISYLQVTPDLSPGTSVSCGSSVFRSNVWTVSYDVPPVSSELLNIGYTAVYIGLELKLSEINVVWNNLNFSSDDCYQDIHYTARLTNNNNMMQNGDCSNMTCLAKFLLETEGKQSDIYFITVTAYSGTQIISSGLIPFNTSVGNGFTIRNGTDCNQRIVCSSNNNDNCSVRYRESESSSFKSFEIYKERVLNFTSKNQVYLEITKSISPNQTFIAQINYTADNSRLNYNGYVGVGVTLMILGFIIQIVGSVVLVHWVMKSIKKSSIDQRVFLWVILHGMSWILAIVTLSLWISYGVVNNSGSCTSGPEGPIAIVATLMSILLVVVSAVITGALLLVDFKCERKKTQEEPEKVSYDDKYKLLFKNEYTETISDISRVHNCECGAKFYEVKTLKDLPFAMLGTTVPRKTCRTCPKNSCKDCIKYAFRKQAQKLVQVCEDCYKGFENEKERILKLPYKLGLFEPIKQKYNGICYECENSLEEKQNVENCKGCGQWVCDKCIVESEEVYLQYSNTSEYVCRNCYALIKIMEGNLKPANEYDDKVNDDVAHETQPEIMKVSSKSEHKKDLEELRGELPGATQLKIMQGKGDKTEGSREESLDSKL